MNKEGIHIGTSGWVYKSWHKRLYPPELKRNFLTFYSHHFNSVEINTSFYHLPTLKTFRKWYSETPDTFQFAVKISRYITHIRRLKDCEEPLTRFLTKLRGLKNRATVVLIQLPPLLAYKKKLFANFLRDLQASIRKTRTKTQFALEPRHWSWFDEKNIGDIRNIARKNDMALVFAHSSAFPHFDPDDAANITTDFIYIRFHGPREFAASQYGQRLLRPWSQRIERWRALNLAVFAYFNDDAHGYAVKDARTLMKLSGVRVVRSDADQTRMPRKYSKKSQRKVKRAMHEMKRGKLKSGRSGKTVRSRKQAIAIGLSEARKEGAKVPRKRK